MTDYSYGSHTPAPWRTYSSFLKSLVIEEGITHIGEWAYYFTGSLTIPSSVNSIGEYAFSDCRGFTGSLTISNSANSIFYKKGRFFTGG